MCAAKLHCDMLCVVGHTRSRVVALWCFSVDADLLASCKARCCRAPHAVSPICMQIWLQLQRDVVFLLQYCLH